MRYDNDTHYFNQTEFGSFLFNSNNRTKWRWYCQYSAGISAMCCWFTHIISFTHNCSYYVSILPLGHPCSPSICLITLFIFSSFLSDTHFHSLALAFPLTHSLILSNCMWIGMKLFRLETRSRKRANQNEDWNGKRERKAEEKEGEWDI